MDPIKRPFALLALVIVLTILACVVIKQLTSAEADTLASSLSSPSVTLIHPAPNIDVYFAQKGNTEPIYHQGPGPSWFSLQDRSGRIVAQGSTTTARTDDGATLFELVKCPV